MDRPDQPNRDPRPRLVAVVVTHNRLAQLQITLPRLLEKIPPRSSPGVVVVDNASPDGTAAWLARQNDARLRVLRVEANLGGAGGSRTRHAPGCGAFRSRLDRGDG